MDLAELRAELRRLDRLTGVERARAARTLNGQARAALAAAGDEGVYQATRDTSYQQVAEALGWAEVTVNRAVTRHLGRTRA